MATLSKQNSGDNIKGGVNKDSGGDGGIRNFIKVKSLYYLWLLRVAQEVPESGMPYRKSLAMASDIAKWSLVNVKSLRVLLARWREASWGYVSGGYFPGYCTHDGREHWLYRLNDRGKRYIESIDAWYSRSKEAKEAVLNGGVLKHDEATGGDSFEGIPHDILQPIVWLPDGSIFDVTLSYPFRSAQDIKGFPTQEAVRLMSGNDEFRLVGDYGIRARNLKEAMAMVTTYYQLPVSVAFQAEALEWQKSAIRQTQRVIAKKYDIKG